jgi:hypothetical protein
MTDLAIDGEAERMRFIYYSLVARSVTRHELKRILASAQRRNAAASVTGALCLDNRYFFQVLEGSRRALNETLGRIVRDPRHSGMSLMLAEAIDTPGFSAWTMAFIGADELSQKVCEKYCGDSVFRPDRMTSKLARSFALKFLASAAAA